MVNDCLGSCDVFVEQIQQRDAGNVLCLNFQVSIVLLFLPFFAHQESASGNWFFRIT